MSNKKCLTLSEVMALDEKTLVKQTGTTKYYPVERFHREVFSAHTIRYSTWEVKHEPIKVVIDGEIKVSTSGNAIYFCKPDKEKIKIIREIKSKKVRIQIEEIEDMVTNNGNDLESKN